MQPSYTFTLSKSVAKDADKKIIFILPDNKHHTGGDKVIYRQSELINKLNIPGISSQILHPKNPAFKLNWFDHQAKFKNDLTFDPKRDFVIVPEVWAAPHAEMLNAIGVKYGIYVQNGYSINIPIVVGYDKEKFNQAYLKASVILSISDDTTECIKLAFPEYSGEVLRMFYSVDAKKFSTASDKENLITYMPRKLASHSKMVLFFLSKLLPPNWKVEPIDGLSESGVRDILSRSKIFLSFSEFEGCPLPPVEAALSGNQVVGYTGEGAKEYWHLPMFTSVACGDIRNYVHQILNKIEYLEKNPSINTDQISHLAKRYDADAEQTSILHFINSVNHALK